VKLLVGLGNPGPRYERTRHNAGYLVVDRLASRHAPGQTPKGRFQSAVVEARIGGTPCLLMKPGTFMNRSGQAVGEAVRFHKADPAADLLVIVDDVALPCGSIRVRPGGGAGGHNGLSDIQRALGTDAYARLRIGIDAAPPFMDQADYVLGRFSEDQWAAVEPSLERAADAAEAFVAEGVDAAMNRFNTRAPGRGEGPDSPRPAGDEGLHPGWFGGSQA
jgi:peptidyl-tRNA hydrolase, PTH1 family